MEENDSSSTTMNSGEKNKDYQKVSNRSLGDEEDTVEIDLNK